MQQQRMKGVLSALVLMGGLAVAAGQTQGQAILTVAQTPGSADFTRIQDAIDAAATGDIVQINDSATYPEHLRIAKNSLTLRAAQDEHPVLSGTPGAPDTLDLMDVSGSTGVTIQGLTLMGGTDDGITASPGPAARDLTIEHCRFEALNDTGIILNANSSAIIRENVFIALGTGTMRLGNAVNILNGSTVLVEGNSFENLLGTAVLVSAASATIRNNIFLGGIMNGEFSDGVAIVRSSVDILANQFIETGRLPIGTFPPQDDSSPRVTSTVNIINNLLAGSGYVNAQAGIGMQLVGTTNTRNTFHVINNTIADNPATGILYAVEGPGSSVNLVNNILAFSGGAGDILLTRNAAQRLSALTARHNLIEKDLLMLVGSNGNISGDPLFRDPGDLDYRLQASSPAIDAGDSTVAGVPATDLDGNPRIVGTSVDLGAYERQADQ